MPARRFRVVHAPRVAVRSSPSTSGTIVGSRPFGEEFPVLEEAGGWVKVVHGGRDAWMLIDGSNLGLGLLLSALPQLDTPVVTRTFSLALAVQLPSLPAGAGALHLRVQTLDEEHGGAPRVLGPFEAAARQRPVDVLGLRPAQRVRLRAEASGESEASGRSGASGGPAEASGGPELLTSAWVEVATRDPNPHRSPLTLTLTLTLTLALILTKP